MKTYHICYIMEYYELEKSLDVLANNKAEAYDKATFEVIPKIEGAQPYAARVDSVTYNNGNHKIFNTVFGLPY